jgi:hypothetical protein
MRLRNTGRGVGLFLCKRKHLKYRVPHKFKAVGELTYLAKYGKNVKRRKLQIMCFLSPVRDSFT